MFLNKNRAMKQEHSRLEKVLIETITMLCKNSLAYSTELKIQGVLAVTIDTDNVLVVHIDKALDAFDTQTLAAPSNSSVKQEYPECSSTGREIIKSHHSATVRNVQPMNAYGDSQDTEEVDGRNIASDDVWQQREFEQSQDSENDVLIVEGTESENKRNMKCEFENQYVDTFRGPPIGQNYQESRAISYGAMDNSDFTGASNFDYSPNCGLNLSLSVSRGSTGKVCNSSLTCFVLFMVLLVIISNFHLFYVVFIICIYSQCQSLH